MGLWDSITEPFRDPSGELSDKVDWFTDVDASDIGDRWNDPAGHYTDLESHGGPDLTQLGEWDMGTTEGSGPDLPSKPNLPKPPKAPDMSQYYDIAVKNKEMLNAIAREQLGISRDQQKIATETYERWKSKLKPVQLAFLEKTKQGINPQIYVERARNAVMQQATPAMKAAQQASAKSGVDSSSTKGVARVASVGAGLAKAMGTAEQSKADQIDSVNRSRKAQAVNMGKSIPGTTVQGLSAVSNQMGGAANTINSGNMQLADAVKGVQMTNYNQAMQEYNYDYQNTVNQYNYDVQMAELEASGGFQAIVGGAMGGAGTGAMIGGPWGALIGGVVGGGAAALASN